ncbi:unnamed protein product, partial [marine sediment metagenome]
MILRIAAIMISLLAFACSMAAAQEAGKVDALLEEIDRWVTTDTARILSYIDSANAITTQTLESSDFWAPTVKDLSFLLGIDFLGGSQVDNTGRIYFQMRITGESQVIFYTDNPMGWPTQLTPNSWAEEGFTISGYSVHPSGDYILVKVNKFGDEMHDIWYFSRDGKFRNLLENRSVRYSGIIFNEDNPDQFYLYIDNRKEMYIGRYTIPTGKLDTLYTEPGAFYPTDYHKGKISFIRWFSFSEGQLALYDVSTNEVTDLSDTSLFWAAGFTEEGKIIALTSEKSKDDEFMKVCIMDPAKPKKFKVIYDPKKETDEFLFIKKEGISVPSS